MIRRLGFFGAAFLGLCSLAVADDVTLTSAYPTPYGEYGDLTIQDSVTVGKKATATGAATIYGNLAIAGPEDISVWGPLIVDPAAIIADSSRPGFFRADPNSVATLRVETDTIPSPPCAAQDWYCQSYWVSIGKTNSTAQSELDVNGPIYAGEFRAADGPLEQTLFLETRADNTTAPPRTWGQLRAQDPAGWAGPRSVLRVFGQKKIVLNRNSPGKVLVGTNTVPAQCAGPSFKFCVSNTLQTRMNTPAPYSSRAFKRDIAPLSASDYQHVADWLGQSNAIYFRYKEDSSDEPLRLGLVAEQAPPEILSDSKQNIAFAQLVGALYAAAKYLHEQNQELEAEVSRLEAEVNAP